MRIDWLYHRNSCITCKRAEQYRTRCGTEVTETVDARKVRYDSRDSLKLLTGIETLIAVKGKKVDVFDLKNARPTDAVLLAHLMGPTGNLRAPTARIGKTLLVGFNEEAYSQVLGGRPVTGITSSPSPDETPGET